MEILPIYLKEQETKLKNAGLKLNMIYLLDTASGKTIPKKKWEAVNKRKLGNLGLIVEFLKEVEETKLRLEPVMYEISEKMQKQVNDKYIGQIIDKAIKSPSWRERATIMNIIGKMNNYNLENDLFYAALSVEMMQEAFMLRDDIFDEQEICVNNYTIPKVYGRIVAELAKDVLLSESRNIMLKTNNFKLISLLEEMIMNDAFGQWIDMKSENLPYDDGLEKDYYKMIRLTPGTQFKNIAAIAGILTGMKRRQITALQEWGLRFGMAAQLRDDIIDIIGDEEVVYKKLWTDIARRKKRLPLILFLKNNPGYRDLFSQKGMIPEEHLPSIILKIRSDGVIDLCISYVKELTKKAFDALDRIEESQGKRLLQQLLLLISNFEED